MAFSSWEMRPTCGRTTPGRQSLPKWRPVGKSVLVSQSPVLGTRKRPTSFRSRGNWRRLRLPEGASVCVSNVCLADIFVHLMSVNPTFQTICRTRPDQSFSEQCHDTRDNHGSIKCEERCERKSCPRGHTCPRKCWEFCGNCQHLYGCVHLNCGHVKDDVPW